MKGAAAAEGRSGTLTMPEAIYRYFSENRRRRFDRDEVRERFPECRIISVGNITTGGTGKTPAVQWLARRLAPDARAAVVARGYGGRASEQGAVVSDGTSIFLDAENAGDEPLLHARALPGVPVLIGRDRGAAVRRAIAEFGADLILLDDAFQYWSLHRDFDLVLLDARRPFDNGRLLPRGHLRELPAALERAGAILLTRCDMADAERLASARASIERWTDAPLFTARHRPVALRDERVGVALPLESLSGQPVGVLSALADNRSFLDSVKSLGATVVDVVGRRDHHRWTPRDMKTLGDEAMRKGARALLTTEKDAVKIQAGWTGDLPLWSLVVELEVDRGEELRGLVGAKSNLQVSHER